MLNRPLFKVNNIKLSTEWFEKHKDFDNVDLTEDFIVNNEDRSLASGNLRLYPNLQGLDKRNEDDDYVEQFQNAQPTLLFDNNDLVKTIAPGEGIQPRSILSDKDAEELTFIKIYGGEKFQPKIQIKYGMRCKSEFRRFDRRCANDINKLFYSYKKLVSKKLNAAIDTCLRKTKEIESMTARDALNKQKINDLIV
ncbi:ATP-dependent DNA helicase PIF1, partial [Brachionus plicatilis]